MLYFSSLQSFSNRLLHGVTQATEGNFNDEHPDFKETLKKFTEENQLPHSPHYLQQIHSKNIIKIDSADQPIQQGDALITNVLNLPLMVKTADCQGIVVYAPDVQALGVVHSGWRGSAQNIIGHSLKEMMKQYKADPQKMRVAIGPSLGPCCAEFTDPQKELPEFCHPFIHNRNVDFWSLSRQQCKEAGVPAGQIEITEYCTQCQPGYFSHRRGDEERFVTWGMLK